MKRYDVFDLYVVNINEELVICKKKFNKRDYKEILSNTWIKDVDNRLVRPLKMYFGFEVVKLFAIGEPLLLTKQELELKQDEINLSYLKNKQDMMSNVYLDENDRLDILEQTSTINVNDDIEKDNIKDSSLNYVKRLVKK